MNTMRQAMTETANRLAPRHARMIANTKAIAPPTGDAVASIIAGNVIAANVT